MTSRGESGAGRIMVEVDADLEDLIPRFLDNRYQDLQDLWAALEAKDLDRVRRIGHTLKGVGGGYGFDALTDFGRSIEDAAAAGDEDTARLRAADTADYLARVEVVFVEVE